MVSMPSLPSGTVTFLFTDIEGSTKLWEQHPEAMRLALARHDALVAATMSACNGLIVKQGGQGDSAFGVFERATDAVAAALTLQQQFAVEEWPAETPLRVRVALHTGEAEARDGDYYGPAVNRCARLRDAAHGGQALVSRATEEVVRDRLPAGATLRDLGIHRLADLARPERVFQLVHADIPEAFPALRSLDAQPNNLPIQLTSFVGRESEMGEVKRRLNETRLLTLTGVGGCGKTRLALQVAAQVLHEFPQGVWLADLTTLSDAALVPQAVADAMGVREEPGRPVLDTLAAHLSQATALLLLDNCEHLLDPCRELCDTLLHAAPMLRILATSHEALGTAGEVVWRVPSLVLPAESETELFDALARSEAAQLFTARARAVLSGFVLSETNARAVVQICRRLDGIPLAIELAAARVTALSVHDLLLRLDDRFRLLTGGSRGAAPRHQSLAAAVSWSYDFLSEPERTTLQRLSVFAGSFSLDAAEAVCAGEDIDAGEVLDLVSRLVGRSLVVLEEDEATRYRLHETIRHFAADRLLGTGNAAAVQERHAGFFLDLAERADPELTGPDQAHWFQRLDDDLPNLRRALDFSSDRGGVEDTLRMSTALGRFWWSRNHSNEGFERLTQALKAPGAAAHTRERIRALYMAWRCAESTGRGSASVSLLEECAVLSRELGDQEGLALALNGLGKSAMGEGNLDAARGYCEQSLAIWRELGDRHYIGNLLGSLGLIECFLAHYDTAGPLLEESLALARELGDHTSIAITATYLARVAVAQRNFKRAQSLLKDSLTVSREWQDSVPIVDTLETWAMLEVGRKEFDRGLRLCGAAEGVRSDIRNPQSPLDWDLLAPGLARAREALGDAAADAALSAGRAMNRDQAVAFALEDLAAASA